MTPYQEEQFEILRRIMERGKAIAEVDWGDSQMYYTDIFVHLLDELERLKNSFMG